MASKNTPRAEARRQAIENANRRYIINLTDFAATLYVAITAIVLPLYMSREKYTAITAAKAGFFSTTSILILIVIAALIAAWFVYTSDGNELFRLKTRKPIKQVIKEKPIVLADMAIVAYWLLMLVSCLLSDDRRTAFTGLDPRNNGFLYQTLYVAAYFVVSRAMKPAEWKGLLFVWGGAILSVPTILHYYGADPYDVVNYTKYNSDGKLIAGTISADYAGPFWNSSSYRFLGPMGNVNLGSYVLCIALVLAAGFYIIGIRPKFFRFQDKYGISIAVCYAVTLFAEININTDAGLVAIAAAVLAIPLFLCSSLERLGRTLTVFAVSAAVILLDNIVDSSLCGDGFGTTGKLLLVVTVVFAILAAAVILIKNKEKVRAIVTPKRMRIAMCSLVALAVVGGIAMTLVITEPDEPAVGALSGATAVLSARDLTEKSDTILHELGQILRGNLDDSFGHNRLFTWKRTLSLIKYNPLFGIGPDNFKSFFASYYKAEAVEMFPASNGNIDKAHNEFLDVLLSNGIIGFAAYLIFFGALLWCCFRKECKHSMAPVFGVAVVSYMAHALFGYQLPIQSPVMWIMIGAAAAFAAFTPEPAAEGKRRPAKNPRR